MKYLLDTCTLIYFLMGQKEKVSDKVRSLFNQPEEIFFVSMASFWEIVLKFGIGKLFLKDKPGLWILDEIKKAGFRILPIEATHVFHIGNLPFHHKDPFDRLLISQAHAENISVITSDQIFKQYNISVVW